MNNVEYSEPSPELIEINRSIVENRTKASDAQQKHADLSRELNEQNDKRKQLQEIYDNVLTGACLGEKTEKDVEQARDKLKEARQQVDQLADQVRAQDNAHKVLLERLKQSVNAREQTIRQIKHQKGDERLKTLIPKLDELIMDFLSLTYLDPNNLSLSPIDWMTEHLARESRDHHFYLEATSRASIANEALKKQ